MFRKRDAQTSLFSTSHLLPDEKRRRLEEGWPGEFRRSALPLIDEEAFRELYHESNGRPNKPVQTVIGVLLLKEMNDLTDAEALFNLDFNLAWHVALDLDGGCPHRDRCPAKPLRDGRRVLRTTVHAAVLARRRRYEKTKEFRKRYAERAGIEATNSELKRAHGLGRLRIRGSLRVRLAVYLKALACNVRRMVKHLAGQARKAANAAAAAAEGAADAATCVILRLLGPREAAPAAPVARPPAARAGRRHLFRPAAA